MRMCKLFGIRFIASDTGWRRPIGRLKLQVIVRKRATNYRALLRNMTRKDRASYGSLPSCTPWRRHNRNVKFVHSLPYSSPLVCRALFGEVYKCNHWSQREGFKAYLTQTHRKQMRGETKCVYANTHTDAHTHTHTHTFTRSQAHTHMYFRVLMCQRCDVPYDVPLHIDSHTHTHTHAHAHKHTHTCIVEH